MGFPANIVSVHRRAPKVCLDYTKDSSVKLFERNVTQCANFQSDSVTDGSTQEKVTRNDLSTEI